jgi:CDP-paratose 2-epimerase
MLEAIHTCERITGRAMKWTYSEANRTGDHIWWISDVGRFQAHYPDWQLTYDVPRILEEIYSNNVERWTRHGEEAPVVAIPFPKTTASSEVVT